MPKMNLTSLLLNKVESSSTSICNGSSIENSSEKNDRNDHNSDC